MNSIKIALNKKIQSLLDYESVDFTDHISEPPKAEMGDFALPCFVLRAAFRGQSPAKIAEYLAGIFKEDDLFESAEAAGPFLNIRVKSSAIAPQVLPDIILQTPLADLNYGEGKTVVVDYSSPNIAKHLGVHHLRSTMIGNAICNLHEKCGYKVARINYLGDWGTQFGKLLAALSESNYSMEDLSIDTIANIYVEFTKRAEERPELNEEARAWFKKLEDGDETAFAIWGSLKAASLKEFDAIYQRLGVTFTQFDGESYYSQAALTVVQECLDKGIAMVGEGGAVVVEMGKGKVPCMLQKSDGATTYLARDVGAVIKRFEDHHFDKMLYVVGHGQSFHFEQVFYVLEKMGHDFFDKCHHTPFGLLKFEGSKFSSRKGNLLLLRDVLDTAAEEVSGVAKEKGNDLAEDTIDKIGIGAVVFADLSRKRTNDANFKWEDILNFDGSTGPYLQYTLTRCNSILNKSLIKETGNYSLLTSPEEKGVILKLAQFGEEVGIATENCDPASLCQYALKLAKATNKFIHTVRIIQKDKELEKARVTLVHGVSVVMSEILCILGISSPQKM